MKVLLLFPPHWVPAMPHLALPVLTAYLRTHGVEVVQRDLNVELFDHILTKPYLQQAVQRLQHLRQEPPPRRILPPGDAMAWGSDYGPILIEQVEWAKGVLKSETFFDGPTSLRAFETIEQCLALASLPFYPSSLEFTRFAPPVPVDNSQTLLQAVRDPQQNLFYDAFKRRVATGSIVADIERDRPDVIGISIVTMDQMLAAMTLCYLIKETGVDCHITIGGPHVSMLRESLIHRPDRSLANEKHSHPVRSIWDLFDSAIVFSGQIPLLRLVEALDGDGDLSVVPNLIYRDRGSHRNRVCENRVEQPPKIQDLPMPDFDGLPLDRYLVPKLILPLVTAHGCYYGMRPAGSPCAFCNQGYGGPERFSQLDAKTVVERMVALRDKYGARHIFFADEAITPRNLRDMSVLLERERAGRDETAERDETALEWITCVRFEKQLTQSLLEQMARGGCRMLLFGLESGSELMIEKIGKGTNVDQVSRILQEGAKAGIWNHLFFFFGFPGETMDNAQETVNLVYKHQQHVHSASPGTFLLERYAPAHLRWKQYEIEQVIQPPQKDLAIYYNYQVRSGLNEAMAERVVDSLLGVLPEKQFGQYYVHDSYRFLYASYLRRQGKNYPLWLVEET
ncbi:MAG: radical SAM protein [Anaerolineae bacterium]|nr:radical SAM protein [Anaerolineae bacterium]